MIVQIFRSNFWTLVSSLFKGTSTDVDDHTSGPRLGKICRHVAGLLSSAFTVSQTKPQSFATGPAPFPSPQALIGNVLIIPSVNGDQPDLIGCDRRLHAAADGMNVPQDGWQRGLALVKRGLLKTGTRAPRRSAIRAGRDSLN
jgi:hypothetical protein